MFKWMSEINWIILFTAVMFIFITFVLAYGLFLMVVPDSFVILSYIGMFLSLCTSICCMLFVKKM